MANEKRLIDVDVANGYIQTFFADPILRMAANAVLDNTPKVDAVEVVHGGWEEWWPGISLIMTGEEMLYRCSICDAKYADVEGYKYCPKCGAKMDTVED